MTSKLFLVLVALFPIADLGSAVIFSITGNSSISNLRMVRDFIVLILFIIALYKKAVPARLLPPIFVYASLVFLYTLISIANGLSLSLILSSAAILMLPIMISVACFAVINPGKIIDKAIAILIIYSVINVLFGLWEKENTQFWQYTISYGDYLRNVKGVVSGFYGAFDLPWNFFGYQLERRSAGLLASPLANGFFMATISIVIFSKYVSSNKLGYLFLFLGCLVGVYLSGTRGSYLFIIFSIASCVLLSREDMGSLSRTLFISLGVIVLAMPVMQEVVYYTINFLDGSTIGHYRAILANISGLMDVTFLGYGIGLAGARASAIGNEIVGGGEGALFSIAYQLGVPGSLAFLWFYLRLFRELSHYPLYSKSGVQRKMACIAILIGASTSLIISEHLLTFSGSAAIWILVSLSIACMKAESQIYAANLFPRRAFDINSKSIAYV